MINPKRTLFKWGPIDAEVIYIEPFVEAFVEFPKVIDGTWPDLLGLFKDHKVVFALDDKHLRDRGEDLFKKYILDDKKLKKGYDDWLKTLKVLSKYEKLVNKGLQELSDKELLKEYNSWNKAHIDFWIYGFLPELSNWGAERLLQQKILEKHKGNFIEIFEALSAPEELSFFQKEEIELLKIKSEKGLEKHQKKYYWLRNSYGHTQALDENYFKKELEKISEEEAKKKIEEIESYPGKITSRKKAVIKKHNVSEEIVKIAKKLAYCMNWQDYRKKFIFIANHINTVFGEEISKRKNISFEDICFYTRKDLIELLDKNKRVDISKRKKAFVTIYNEGGGIEYLEGDEALAYSKPFLETRVNDIKEIKGLVVSKGKKNVIKGKARIVLTPKESSHFKHGDILVAPMTSPDFVTVMRKAAAIITDEGGMTSHAAIVSRELGIPCIVGTKIATKVLKDGDLVEVDADKGIVRRIK